MAAVNFKQSNFTIRSAPSLRQDPNAEFQHRLNTKAHLQFLQDEKLLNVTDSRWASKVINGEKCYAHEYNKNLLIVRLKTADGKFNLSHNENGAFDQHLRDTPGENCVYAIDSHSTGLQSTQTFSVESAGISSIMIVVSALSMTVGMANGVAAADAAAAAGTAIAEIFGVSASVVASGIGLAIAILAFIGIWIAYSVGRDIAVNLIYENRSLTKSINLVDHYVYNIGDNPFTSAINLPPLASSDPEWELYASVVVHMDNYSKIRGIGVSMKFEKEDGTSLIICIRNDIYHQAYYTIKQYPKGDPTTAKAAYDNCGGNLVTGDVPWGNDLIVKNCLDPKGFQKYNFAGILSFNDPKG